MRKRFGRFVPRRKGVKIIRQKPLVFSVSSKTLARSKSWKPRAFVKRKR